MLPQINKTIEQFIKDKPIKLSHSSMETMEQCYRKWFYRYILKHYPETDADTSAADFGKYVHDVAEYFKGHTMKDLYQLAKTKLENYDISDEYKPKTKIALVNFFNYYKQNIEPLPSNKIRREGEFDIPYFVEGFRLKGLIDLIIVPNNKIIIADYKTNKKPKDNTKQLAFYFLVLKMIGIIKADEIDCEIIYLALEDNEGDMVIEKYHLTEDDLDDATDRIETTINIIFKKGTNEKLWTKKIGPLCDYCDYKKSGDCNGKPDKEDIDNRLKQIILKKKKKALAKGLK